MSPRYLIAFCAALVMILGAFVAAGMARRAVADEMREQIQRAIQAREIADRVGADVVDLGIGTTPEMERNLFILDVVSGWWFAWIPLVLTACLGTAAALGKQ